MAFHSDSDYFGFLKFFVLLTDVNVNNGPFTFVRGSHKGKKHVAGRMADKEIVGEDDDLLVGTGRAGDIVIADTMGWHKASQIKEGHRTMIHIIYMTSPYGKATV
jgi:ectoine hydroxylase-related dioxygenase (phytanoyl-CoA dioxygenase family)